MTVAVTVSNRSGWTLDEAAAIAVLQATLAAEGIREGDIGLALVAPDEMAKLNAAHRRKPSPTDVLSFPIDGAGELAPGLPRQLGDVVICPRVAADEGTPVATLLVHAALHLVGYDHEGSDTAMLDRQDVLVKEVADVAISPA